ncbi:MAG: ribosome biogenesis GTP-binding protein YihA/YsxC, partial [Microvirga sp.]
MAPPSLAKPGIAPDSSVMTAPDLEPYLEPGRKLFAGEAGFVWAASAIDNLPPMTGLEIAFAGRSNVGKSSAINAIVGRRSLARTSKTPGRTQTINFFSLGEDARLVDLPGYGYARVPQAMRDAWRALVAEYLQSASVAGIVVIMDARHPLTPLDQQLLDWLGDVPRLVLLSKADKLSRTEQAKLIADMKSRGDATLLFSSV